MVKAARLIASGCSKLLSPDGWVYEGSLSQTFSFVPTEHVAQGLEFGKSEAGCRCFARS